MQTPDPTKLASGPSAPLVSIVVIGRNEGARLARCIESIRNADFKSSSLELIYVDSASTDDSPHLAAKAGALVLSVVSPHPTAALGRNAGWKAARGEFILFLDGDTILHPAFLRTALEE